MPFNENAQLTLVNAKLFIQKLVFWFRDCKPFIWKISSLFFDTGLIIIIFLLAHFFTLVCSLLLLILPPFPVRTADHGTSTNCDDWHCKPGEQHAKKNLKTRAERDKLLQTPVYQYSSSDTMDIPKHPHKPHKKRPKVEELKDVRNKLASHKTRPEPSQESLLFWGQPISKKKSKPSSSAIIKTKSLGGERDMRSALSIKNKESSPANLAGARSRSTDIKISPLARRKSRSSSKTRILDSKIKKSKSKEKHSTRHRSSSSRRPEETKNKTKQAMPKDTKEKRTSNDVNLKPSKKKSKKVETRKKLSAQEKKLKKKKSSHKALDQSLDSIPPLPYDFVGLPTVKEPTIVDNETQIHVSELRNTYEEHLTVPATEKVKQKIGNEKVHWSIPPASHRLITVSDNTETVEHAEVLTDSGVKPADVADSAVQCSVPSGGPVVAMEEKLSSIEQAVVNIQSTMSDLACLVHSLKPDPSSNAENMFVESDSISLPNVEKDSSMPPNYHGDVINNLQKTLDHLALQVAEVAQAQTKSQLSTHTDPTATQPSDACYHLLNYPHEGLALNTVTNNDLLSKQQTSAQLGDSYFQTYTMFPKNDGSLDLSTLIYNSGVTNYIVIDSEDSDSLEGNDHFAGGVQVEEISNSQASLLKQDLLASAVKTSTISSTVADQPDMSLNTNELSTVHIASSKELIDQNVSPGTCDSGESGTIAVGEGSSSIINEHAFSAWSEKAPNDQVVTHSAKTSNLKDGRGTSNFVSKEFILNSKADYRPLANMMDDEHEPTAFTSADTVDNTLYTAVSCDSLSSADDTVIRDNPKPSSVKNSSQIMHTNHDTLSNVLDSDADQTDQFDSPDVSTRVVVEGNLLKTYVYPSVHGAEESEYIKASETNLINSDDIPLPTQKPKKKQSLKSRLAKAFGLRKKDNYIVEKAASQKSNKSSNINIDELFDKLPPPNRPGFAGESKKTKYKNAASIESRDESYASGSSMPQHLPPPPPIRLPRNAYRH